jgi:hypothetical protein
MKLAAETRQALQALAKERGLSGPSQIVDEAVRFYMAERNKPAVPVETVHAEIVERAPLAERASSPAPGTALAARRNAGTGVLAMFGLPLWAFPFAVFGVAFWGGLMRRSPLAPRRA